MVDPSPKTTGRPTTVLSRYPLQLGNRTASERKTPSDSLVYGLMPQCRRPHFRRKAMQQPNYTPSWRTVAAVLLVPVGLFFVQCALLNRPPGPNVQWAKMMFAVWALMCFGFAALFFLEDLFPSPVRTA